MKFSILPMLLGAIANAQEIMVKPELEIDLDYYGEQKYEPSTEMERKINSGALQPSSRSNSNDDEYYQVMMVAKDFGGEVSWKIYDDATGEEVCSGNGYTSSANQTQQTAGCEDAWVEGNSYTIVCTDSYGDGWHGGYVLVGNDSLCTGSDSFSSKNETFTFVRSDTGYSEVSADSMTRSYTSSPSRRSLTHDDYMSYYSSYSEGWYLVYSMYSYYGWDGYSYGELLYSYYTYYQGSTLGYSMYSYYGWDGYSYGDLLYSYYSYYYYSPDYYYSSYSSYSPYYYYSSSYSGSSLAYSWYSYYNYYYSSSDYSYYSYYTYSPSTYYSSSLAYSWYSYYNYYYSSSDYSYYSYYTYSPSTYYSSSLAYSWYSYYNYYYSSSDYSYYSYYTYSPTYYSYSSYSDYYSYLTYSYYSYYNYYYGSTDYSYYSYYAYSYYDTYSMDYSSWESGYYDYYYGSYVDYYGYDDYYYEDEEEYPGINESRGSTVFGDMDNTWYQVNSWGQTWSNQTCAINADCDGEETQCCVSLLVTDSEGWTEQTFRCQTAGMVEADMVQTHEMDDGTVVEFTMKCLESGSAYIRAGLLAAASLMISVAF